MKKYYELGLELKRGDRIPNMKITHIQDCIMGNDAKGLVDHIIEIYVKCNKSIPNEINELLMECLSNNSITEPEKILCFVIGIYNSKF